ncbi:MAG: hypothetical protein ACRYG5_15275 [Janthinobacterium lividum]
MSTVISGAVSVSSCALSISSASAGTPSDVNHGGMRAGCLVYVWATAVACWRAQQW